MAEDWTDLTAASWDGILHPSELESLDPDTLIRELTKMASEVRTMIASHAPNTLSADPLKIPDGFVGRALLVTRSRLLTGIPNFPIDEDRRKQGESAEAWFREVARGNIRPQPATDAVANEAAPLNPAGAEVVSWRPPRTGHTRMNGI